MGWVVGPKGSSYLSARTIRVTSTPPSNLALLIALDEVKCWRSCGYGPPGVENEPRRVPTERNLDGPRL